MSDFRTYDLIVFAVLTIKSPQDQISPFFRERRRGHSKVPKMTQYFGNFNGAKCNILIQEICIALPQLVILSTGFYRSLVPMNSCSVVFTARSTPIH